MPSVPDPAAPVTGLSEATARERLQAEGHNELPRRDRRSRLRIVRDVLREPMLALLLAGGAIYLVLGDLGEALVLLAFATLSVLITVVQESRTERVMEALRDLSSPRALVIRDGKHTRIAGRDVVRGDCVVLAEGDRVPADAVLVQVQDLQTDESLLTGESVPVRKRAPAAGETAAAARPGGDDLPQVFSGSLVVRGTGIAIVVATGPRTEIGRIGQSLAGLKPEATGLQRQTRRAVLLFAMLGAAVSALAVLLYGLLRGGWMDAVLAGIALGMAMLPEEFPVVLTVFMAMGAWRISRARVLTRRAAAIETLGSATVLCTDKTGTLTENRMSIAELRLADGSAFRPGDAGPMAMPDAMRALLDTGILASAPTPFDPMELAFHALGRERGGTPPPGPGSGWSLVRSYGLRPELLAMSQAWLAPGVPGFVVAAKGAPEAIAVLCRLDAAAIDTLMASVETMAKSGLRVLGVARADWTGPDWPESQTQFDYRWLGLVGLADPLRPGVREAVAECHSAGIRVLMITGDYPATAAAIAGQAGIPGDGVVTGEQLAGDDAAALAQRLRGATVFARIMPEQKLRIVQALRGNGDVVAMTGDGVNDAPSLKAADIGIAMGGRGTDVAREASSIVLLDDNFGSVVTAVRLGRRIYDNLRKAMGFILAVHVPIAGLALLPLVTGLPILFSPMHIAFLEMIIDPVCSLVFEAETEEDDVMQRPPRAPDEPLFSRALLAWSVVQGGVAFAAVAAVYLLALQRGLPEDEVRALSFLALVASIVALIFVNRSFGASLARALRRPNAVLAWCLLAVSVLLATVLAWPAARTLFRFGPLDAGGIATGLAVGLAVLLLLEAGNALRGRFTPGRSGRPR